MNEEEDDNNNFGLILTERSVDKSDDDNGFKDLKNNEEFLLKDSNSQEDKLELELDFEEEEEEDKKDRGDERKQEANEGHRQY